MSKPHLLKSADYIYVERPCWILTRYNFYMVTKMHIIAAESIWFKIWGSWIRVKRISIFQGKFPRNFDFFRYFHKRVLFSQANFIFQAISGKISILHKNFAICRYF